MSYLDILTARVAVKKADQALASMSPLEKVAKEAEAYAVTQATVLKWTPEGEAKAKASRAAHLAANPTSHEDSIPRGKRDEARHQKELASENWHTSTMAKFRDKGNDSLNFIRQDAAAAAKANPENPKAGQYMDEVHYAGMELANRQKHLATKKSDGSFSSILVTKNWDKFDAARGKGGEASITPPAEASAAKATDFSNHPEAKKLKKDFMQSMATIAGVDSGKDTGWNRALFVNSIGGKIKRVNKTNPELAKHLLNFVKTTHEKHVAAGHVMKPVFAPSNSIWNEVGLPTGVTKEDSSASFELVQKNWAEWNAKHGKDSSSTPGYSEERLGKTLDGLRAKNDDEVSKNGGSLAYKKHYTVEHGKKYAKIVATNANMTTGEPSPFHRSVHSFIDKTNGNVLKANSWKAPHPTPRGNIGDGNYGMKAFGSHGANYANGSQYS